MSGEIKVDGSGSVQLKETDGIDYAPVTVQLPGGMFPVGVAAEHCTVGL